jgi:hypothetical protein
MPMSPRLLRPLASGFNPKTIAGLVGWWDPSDTATVTTDSGAVSQLNDKSGLGRHATQTTPNNRPAYSGTLNGRNVMTFDGSNDVLVTGLESSTLTDYVTMFCVCRADFASDADASNKAVLYGRDSSTFANSYGLNLHNVPPLQSQMTWRGVGFNVSGSPAYTRTTAAVLVGRMNATQRERRVNGTSVTSTGTFSAGTNAAAGNFLRIGEDGPGLTRFWNGLVGEALVYDRSLTAAEIAKIEGYLGKKWGITIA